MQKRSIGFSTFVGLHERNLFNMDDFGITDSGMIAAKTDLDIPEVDSAGALCASLSYFVWASDDDQADDLLAVVRFQCPEWFEPTRKRLALNDLAWMDTLVPVNNIDDFDPWSRAVMLAHHDQSRTVHATIFS
jgi:hypothetical protein